MKGVIDKLGMDLQVKQKDKTHFTTNVNVCTSPTFYAWVFQWGGSVRIIAPRTAVEEYQEMVRKAMN